MIRMISFLMMMVLLGGSLPAQEKYLQSGPMVGYSEMMEVLLWVQTNAPAKVKFVYYEKENPGKKYSTVEKTTLKNEAFTAKLIADQVQQGRHYEYKLYINGKHVKRPYPLRFQTQKLWQWREDPPPFSFIIGSCAYINDTPHDRPGNPYGGEYEIFNAIFQQQADMMIWLGDNVYLREVDWYSRTGIFYRYTHTRSEALIQPLLGSMHHYATWDDHDFGPNNSDRSFRNKDDALEAFKLFWGNPTFGVNGNPGVTTMFQWQDVEFFLLDNRYYRSPNNRRSGEREIFGKAQVEWLIDALSSSFAPFKFVVSGGQVLNSVARFENLNTVPGERARLLNAIAENDISGVFFLSGDRHHSELSMLTRRGSYPLYDLTISPLTAGANRRAESESNDYRVEGTFVNQRNFAQLAVSGKRTDRVLKINVFDKDGNQLWERSIKATDLR